MAAAATHRCGDCQCGGLACQKSTVAALNDTVKSTLFAKGRYPFGNQIKTIIFFLSSKHTYKLGDMETESKYRENGYSR